MNNNVDEKENLSVLLMAPNPESIGAVLADLLRRTMPENMAQLDQPEHGSLEEDIRYYFSEISRIILNLMSADRGGALEEFATQFENVLRENDHDDLSERAKLACWASVMIHAIRIYFRGDSLAKKLASVAGIRRNHWGLLLALSYEQDCNLLNLSGEGISQLPSPLNELKKYADAVAGLKRLGYVADAGNLTGGTGLTLTFAGRGLARALINLHHEDDETTGPND